jgi:SAM-dependent methyltransferase
MSDYAAFKELEVRGWSDAARAAHYVKLFATAADQAIGPLLHAAGVRTGAKVLDLCCGHGNVSEALAARGCKVTGADFSPAMLEMARQRAPGATLIGADAQNLPFANAEFDIVVSNLGICHVPDQPRALTEVHRVLRPGGRFAMTVWCGPDKGPGYEMVYRTVKACGAPGIGMAPGPDFHQFANPVNAQALLTTAGFSAIQSSVVPSGWDFDRPEGFVEMFERGTVRAAELLSRQPPQNLAAIQSALTNEVRERFANGNHWRVPAPAALISATA